VSEPRYTARNYEVYEDGKRLLASGRQRAAEIAAKLECHDKLVASLRSAREELIIAAKSDVRVDEVIAEVDAALELAKKAGA
jgi:hypothetical protein